VITHVSRDAAGAVELRFLAVEGDFGSLMLRVEYDLLDVFPDRWTAASSILPRLEGERRYLDFPRSGEGNTRSFFWDRAEDIGDRNVTVRLRIAASDDNGSTVAVTEVLHLARLVVGEERRIDVFDAPDMVGVNLNPVLSRNGRYVAFESDVEKLVDLDFNGVRDVFLFDRNERIMERVSESESGVEGNARSRGPSMSYDGRFVCFESQATNLGVPGAPDEWRTFVKDAVTEELFHVPPQHSGGDLFDMCDPVLSGNGRFVVFRAAYEPAAEPVHEIFLHDLETGITTRISLPPEPGEEGVGNGRPTVSDDGRFVCYATQRSLAPEDTEGMTDVYVFDALLVCYERCSVNAAGVGGDRASTQPSISGDDGRFVVFQSSSGNLTPDATYPILSTYLFLRDRSQGRTTLVSLDENGIFVWGKNGEISDDGAYISFDSFFAASPLVHERLTGRTRSFAPVDQAPLFAHNEPVLSGDGNTVAFHSAVAYLANDVNPFEDVYIFDREGSVPDRPIAGDVSATIASSDPPVLSADGRFIAFCSATSNLVVGDTNGFKDVFLQHLETNEVERVSLSPFGDQADGDCHEVSISHDGRYVAFLSDAENLVLGDSNLGTDLFVLDRWEGTLRIASRLADGRQAGDVLAGSIALDGRFAVFQAEGIHVRDLELEFTKSPEALRLFDPVGSLAVSLFGRRVVFSTFAALQPMDTNASLDVYAYDVDRSELHLVSQTPSGFAGNHGSWSPSISSNGNEIVFTSEARNLIGGNVSGAQIYLRDLTHGVTRLMSANEDGVPANGNSTAPRISPDGSFVVFESRATNLFGSDLNGLDPDAFLIDIESNRGYRISGIGGGYAPNLASSGRAVYEVEQGNHLGRSLFEFAVTLPGNEGSRVRSWRGLGLNVDELRPLRNPDLGSEWLGYLELHSIADGASVFLSEVPASGIFVPAGEILLELASSNLIAEPSSFEGRFGIIIPNDLSLVGQSHYLQAYIVGPEPRLTNALELRFDE